MENWQQIVVAPEMPLGKTIACIDASALQIALVADNAGRLVGVVTDGDIRRAILRGVSLETPTSAAMNSNPRTLPVGTSRQETLAFMRRHVIHHVPMVDEEGRLMGLEVLDALVGVLELPNWVVLMAGGLGTRLRPLTDSCPKPLLSIGGKPILENILESFVEQGFRHFFLSVNYKAEMIRSHFGSGKRWGIQIEYLHETQRLGTAGALSLLPRPPEHPVIVMNGDLLTQANFTSLLDFHRDHHALATMAVREYDFQVPYGVVRLDETRITAVEEKPIQRFFVNAGIYALSPEALGYIPNNSFFDMPTLFEHLVGQGKVTSAYPLREYWLDIGRLDEFERAQREWAADD